MVRVRTASLAIAVGVLGTAACSDDAQFQARFASDFAHARHAVSVLGVFRDGRMNADTWDVVGPKLSTPFGKTCDTGFGALATSNQVLMGAIDDYVRANGPGDELLGELAPAATGDLILVFTIAGKVVPKTVSTTDSSVLQSGTSPGGMGMGAGKYRGSRPGGGSYGSRGMPAAARGPAALEVSASLFSVSQRKSVGYVAMQYDGQSADEALTRMATRLGVAIPGSSCGGWDWNAKVDDKRIRELAGQ
jgi:hypothetical protein